MAERVWSTVTAGVVLTAVTVLLFGASWFLFEEGKPGAPDFPDSRIDYGTDSGVRVYLPSSFDPSRVETTVYFGTADGGGVYEDIDVEVYGDALARDVATVVVELRDAARIDPHDLPVPGPGETESSRTAQDGRQYVVVPMGGRGGGFGGVEIKGTMLIPALDSENSRTSFVSPKFGSTRFCDFLPAGPSASTDPVDVDEFDDQYACTVNSARNRSRSIIDLAQHRPFSSEVTLQIEGYLRRATRLDFDSPSPTNDDGSTTLRWTTKDADDGFRARASYVDIGAEADVQRYLFASGVIVGLGAAVAPLAVQYLVEASRKLRRRRASGGGPPIPAADPPTGDDATPVGPSPPPAPPPAPDPPSADPPAAGGDTP